MHKLNYYFKQNPQIKEIFDYAKIKYNDSNLPQHNWQHIMRDLYRALLIAETEDNVDYSILIISTILHDIGVTEGSHENHEVSGGNIVKRDLPKFNFSEEQINKIIHCIESHGRTIVPTTIEAKIINQVRYCRGMNNLRMAANHKKTKKSVKTKTRVAVERS